MRGIVNKRKTTDPGMGNGGFDINNNADFQQVT